MTDTPGEHPVQNGPVQSENIETASDRAAKDAAEHRKSAEPADTHTDHLTGEAQAAENAETELPG